MQDPTVIAVIGMGYVGVPCAALLAVGSADRVIGKEL